MYQTLLFYLEDMSWEDVLIVFFFMLLETGFILSVSFSLLA
jgi:hypothetical protein